MKVCVIGAGIGGLASACLLARDKHEVYVYEKEKMLGGRALTIKNFSAEEYKEVLKQFDMWIPYAEPSVDEIFDGMLDGYKVDLGFHLMGGGTNAAPMRILSSLGQELEIIGSRIGFIGNKIEYPYLSAIEKLKMLPRILQLLFSRKSTISALESVSMEETIKRYGKGKMKLTLELFPRLITTVNNLSKISTGETFWAQRELMGSHPVAYPLGGMGCIAKKFARWFEEHGGEIEEKKVKKIVIEESAAQGVVVEGAEEFDAVVSNIPVQDLFSIADEKYFPREWVKKMRELEGTGSVCAYYALNELNENLLGKAFMFIERDVGVDGNDAVGMIDFKMAHRRAEMAPRGKYLVQAYIICTPKEAKKKDTVEKLRNILDTYMERLIKNFIHKMEWRIYPTIWHLDGVAKTIDNEKPDVVTPVKNLYMVGDCVKAKGVGINCAADSANVLMEKITTNTIL